MEGIGMAAVEVVEVALVFCCSSGRCRWRTPLVDRENAIVERHLWMEEMGMEAVVVAEASWCFVAAAEVAIEERR